MPVIESCILHRCNFEFLWQLRYDRWMARTRVIKSLLVGPRCILKHHESSHTNFHKKNEVQQKSRIIKKTLTTHYCSYFISVKKQHDLSQVSRNESLHKIWPIPIPMGRAPPKSTPRNGIQRNLGKFRASWLGGAFNAIDSTRDAVRHGWTTSLGLLMHLQFGTTCWKQSWKESCHYSSPTQIQSDVFFLCVLLNIPQASITSVFRPAANQTKGTVQIDAPSACLRDVATGTALVCAAKENLKTNVSRKQTKKTKTSWAWGTKMSRKTHCGFVDKRLFICCFWKTENWNHRKWHGLSHEPLPQGPRVLDILLIWMHIIFQTIALFISSIYVLQHI